MLCSLAQSRHGICTYFLPPSIHCWKHGLLQARLMRPPGKIALLLLQPTMMHFPGNVVSALGVVNLGSLLSCRGLGAGCLPVCAPAGEFTMSGFTVGEFAVGCCGVLSPRCVFCELIVALCKLVVGGFRAFGLRCLCSLQYCQNPPPRFFLVVGVLHPAALHIVC